MKQVRHTRGNSHIQKQSTHSKIMVLKWFFKRLCGFINHRTITEEPFCKWCLKEPYFEDSLRHLYMLFEELFKEMVL